MYCVPACRGCVEAGECSRGALPASAYTDSAQPRKRPYVPHRATRAVVRQTYADTPPHGVIHLMCGTRTTLEAQLFFSAWRPKKKPHAYWCEVHSKWEDATPAIEAQPQPDDPRELF